jgi:hypothetical protein
LYRFSYFFEVRHCGIGGCRKKRWKSISFFNNHSKGNTQIIRQTFNQFNVKEKNKMKKFLFAFLCVLLTAGLAFAVDVDLKGSYYARGSYISNGDGLSGDASIGDREDSADYFFLDHELDMTARLLVTDKTRIIVNMEIHDESWLGDPVESNHVDGNNLDDNIEFKRVFSSHTFDAYGTVLDLGLMTGGAWATSFGDTATGKYRIKVTQPTEWGPVIAIYEKNHEEGAVNSLEKDAEDDDAQGYALAMVTKLGDVNIMPLIQYVNDSYAGGALADRGSDSVDVLVFALGATGTFGDIGFESEFVVKDYDKGDFSDLVDAGLAPIGSDEDYTVWGIYGNGWWNIGAGKVGILAAYGNWDDDAGTGYNMGDDFEPALFAANQADVGDSPTGSEFVAVTLAQLYLTLVGLQCR